MLFGLLYCYGVADWQLYSSVHFYFEVSCTVAALYNSLLFKLIYMYFTVSLLKILVSF